MIAIIKGAGRNITSIQMALERIGFDSVLTDDPEVIKTASHVVLPGVGHAQAGMEALRQSDLIPLIRQLTQPVLGICLGMQLFFESSEEGGTKGLGILAGNVSRMAVTPDLTIPHMGWNQLQFEPNALFEGIENGSYVYFVHSYAAHDLSSALAVTEYGKKFAAVVKYNNFIGMQFHPEKSGIIGEKLLKNFFKMRTVE